MNKVNEAQNNVEFDRWRAMYIEDPEKFERERLELIQSVINEAPKNMQHRLTGLQWRIDNEIKLANNPLAGCIKVFGMMLDSVYKTGGLLDALDYKEMKTEQKSNNVVEMKNRFKEK